MHHLPAPAPAMAVLRVKLAPRGFAPWGALGGYAWVSKWRRQRRAPTMPTNWSAPMRICARPGQHAPPLVVPIHPVLALCALLCSRKSTVCLVLQLLDLERAAHTRKCQFSRFRNTVVKAASTKRTSAPSRPTRATRQPLLLQRPSCGPSLRRVVSRAPAPGGDAWVAKGR
jgi:hypothetical protein